MQYKTLSLLALSATALAAPSPQKNTELEELPNYEEVSSVAPAASETDAGFDLAADVGIPTSVLNVLETAMPLSFITSLADPSFASKVDQDWESGKYPEWYSSLPSDVKDYMNSAASEFGEVSTIPANTALATDNTGKSTTADSASASASATATATATATTDTKGASSSAAHASNSQTTGSQTSGSQTTGSSSASGSSSAAETTGSQGATSEGGAPAPTGAMAASLAGAAGIIGLAFAL